MIPIAFKFQARFPSAVLVLPSGFDPEARGGAAQDWYPTRGLNCYNHRERVAAVLPDVEDLVRREQTNFGVPSSRTVLIGFSQGGTVALEAVKSPGVAGAMTGDSLCANTVWEVRARTVSSMSPAEVIVTQGVGVRVSSDQAGTSC